MCYICVLGTVVNVFGVFAMRHIVVLMFCSILGVIPVGASHVVIIRMCTLSLNGMIITTLILPRSWF